MTQEQEAGREADLHSDHVEVAGVCPACVRIGRLFERIAVLEAKVADLSRFIPHPPSAFAARAIRSFDEQLIRAEQAETRVVELEAKLREAEELNAANFREWCRHERALADGLAAALRDLLAWPRSIAAADDSREALADYDAARPKEE